MSISRLAPRTPTLSLLQTRSIHGAPGYRPYFPTEGKTWAELHPFGPGKKRRPTPTPPPVPWKADFEPLGGEMGHHDVTSFEDGLEEEGGWYLQSKKEGVSLEKERKKELWADPYVRMLQEENTICLWSGHLLPNAMSLKLRSALHRPSPSEHEQFVYVPEDILSPEFDTSLLRPPPEKGLPPQRAPSVALLNDSLKLLDAAGPRLTRLNQAEIPSFEPLRPVIPLGVSLDPKDNVPGRLNLETHRSSTNPGATITPRPLPALEKQIREQLLTRVQQELEILAERVPLSEGLEGRMVLREVGAEEREAMRDEDWRDEGRKVVAVLEVGTPKEEVGQFFHSTPPSPSTGVSSSPPVEGKHLDFRKESLVALLRAGPPPKPKTEKSSRGRAKQLGSIPHSSPTNITCPLLRNLAIPPPSPPAADDVGNLDTVISSPSPPLASPSIPYYPLTHLFPSPEAQSHILSRLIYLDHLSSTPNVPDPHPPLVPSSSPPTLRTFALLSHPSLLGPHGIDTYPLFRALWRVRLWEADAGGWDGETKKAILSMASRSEKVDNREKEDAPALAEQKDDDDDEYDRRSAISRMYRSAGVEDGGVEVEEKGGDRNASSPSPSPSSSSKEGTTPWPSTERLAGGVPPRPREQSQSELQGWGGQREQRGSNDGGDRRGGGSSRGDYQDRRPPPRQDSRGGSGGGGYGSNSRGGGGGGGRGGGFGFRS